MTTRTEQIEVSPMSATLKEIAPGFVHFGECLCPFCGKPTVVVGSKEGKALVWVQKGCVHNMGSAAGHGFEITVLFRERGEE
jgi:hypothetical protein